MSLTLHFLPLSTLRKENIHRGMPDQAHYDVIALDFGGLFPRRPSCLFSTPAGNQRLRSRTRLTDANTYFAMLGIAAS